jgi:hypothetical protein
VIGELLIALLLLAVAVSSLAALMYSVSRRPMTVEETACVGMNAGSAECMQKAAGGGPSKLLRSGCATRTGPSAQSCRDSLAAADSSRETILRPRTDSAAMALLEKKQKDARPAERPDLGFIR